MWDHSLIQLFHKGGLVMWPILFCSVLGIAIILDKALLFWRLRYRREEFLAELRERVLRGDVRGASEMARRLSHPVPQTAAVYLENLNRPDRLRRDLLRREGSMELQLLENRLRGLAAVSHIAPLLGLLGTVAGLVTAFARIESLGGVVQPGDLAGGIWEALLTTVFGLTVAIPCMAAFHHFESRADKIARDMQFVVTTLDEWLGRSTDGQIGGGAAARAETEMTTVG